jgi:hypothetical protein
MTNLDMRIYTAFNGVETTVRCRNEHEFQAIKTFLKEKGADVMGVSENNKPTGAVYVYVETKELIDDLNEFVRSLREKGE